ncbi:MAG: SDR family oxidoreductase [Spirochaetes bacterium]|nr:MAG: SDR family oxidoreductase [Spirochaetota bacterium]
MTTTRKWVLVTGAASGIGKAITELLAGSGWGVYATDIDERGLSQFKKAGNIRTIKIDTTKDKDVADAVKYVQKQKTGLWALVNNAGVFFPGPLMDFPQERFERQFDVNLFGTQRLTRLFFPLLLESRGRIINMSSAAGFLAAPFSGAYAASKHAIEGWSDSLRRELRAPGIEVIIIEPGLIKTPLWGKDHDERIAQFKGSIFYEANRKKLEHEISMASQKGIEPLAVAKAVLESLNAAKPKARYLVTENQIQYKLIKLIKLLSDGTLDNIIHKKLG